MTPSLVAVSPTPMIPVRTEVRKKEFLDPPKPSLNQRSGTYEIKKGNFGIGPKGSKLEGWKTTVFCL